MQHGTLLGDIDLLAAEHGGDALAQVRRLGQLQEQLDGLTGNTVLGVVQVEAHTLGGETLAALWIIGEEPAQVQVFHPRVMVFESFPGGPLRQRCYSCRHKLIPYSVPLGVVFVCV